MKAPYLALGLLLLAAPAAGQTYPEKPPVGPEPSLQEIAALVPPWDVPDSLTASQQAACRAALEQGLYDYMMGDGPNGPAPAIFRDAPAPLAAYVDERVRSIIDGAQELPPVEDPAMREAMRIGGDILRRDIGIEDRAIDFAQCLRFGLERQLEETETEVATLVRAMRSAVVLLDDADARRHELVVYPCHPPGSLFFQFQAMNEVGQVSWLGELLAAELGARQGAGAPVEEGDGLASLRREADALYRLPEPPGLEAPAGLGCGPDAGPGASAEEAAWWQAIRDRARAYDLALRVLEHGSVRFRTAALERLRSPRSWGE
jgi:hypothetical protein